MHQYFLLVGTLHKALFPKKIILLNVAIIYKFPEQADTQSY